MQLTNYRIGLVLSQAGMNAAQLVEVKSRLKFIAKLGGADSDGIKITVPSLYGGRASGTQVVEGLVESLSRIDYVRVEVVQDVRNVIDCLNLLRDADEVWCLPSTRQSRYTKARAWCIYDEAQRFRPGEAHRYKVIPPWVEQHVTEARETKTKAMKG